MTPVNWLCSQNLVPVEMDRVGLEKVVAGSRCIARNV